MLFKNCAPLINCKIETNKIEIDNAKDIDIVMRMCNLIEYSDNYSKTSGRLWQYSKDDPSDNLADSQSFKSKVKITENTPNIGNTKNVEIVVPLKYFRYFWRTLEMSLINCEVNLILTWSSTYVIINSTGIFAIADTKRYVPFVTLSTQDNTKLLQQLTSGTKRTINWTNISQIQKHFHETDN